jgi:2-keto-3-deoxy-L-rhamnonate aldolase RhmA
MDEAATKSALDAGAEGIMFPLITTAESAAECVAREVLHGRPRAARGADTIQMLPVSPPATEA